MDTTALDGLALKEQHQRGQVGQASSGGANHGRANCGGTSFSIICSLKFSHEAGARGMPCLVFMKEVTSVLPSSSRKILLLKEHPFPSGINFSPQHECLIGRYIDHAEEQRHWPASCPTSTCICCNNLEYYTNTYAHLVHMRHLFVLVRTQIKTNKTVFTSGQLHWKL